MEKNKLFIINIGFLLFCEYAACAELTIGDEHANEWGNDLVENCMSFAGEYLSLGEAKIPNVINVRSPRLELAVFGLDRFGAEANSVFIEQLSGLNLKVTLKNSKGDFLYSKNSTSDLTCSGSWLVSESHLKGSGDGSSVLETHTLTKMARSNGGSLIVFVRVNTTSRSFFFMKKSASFDVWYRFSMFKS